ncbi:efflux RND transporter permease subunit [Bradyrhizobium erythrophlei]|uniref:efflux RND transporter permease subunit n=1 Tax=Bradyrhizobium erythrophlei TaxID=1437360 RepID=UPI0035E80181
MNLAGPSLRRPLTVVVAILAVALASTLGLQRMPRDVLPNLNVPTIYVAQAYGGMDPAQMEGYLAFYFEYHFLYITGIQHVESKSIQGAALLKLQFHPGTDMSQAMAETVAYVNRARAFMPPGTLPPFITRFDPGSVPVGHLVFSSETRSIEVLQDAALNLVRPLFATLPGVSAPPPFGGNARSVVVNLKPERLRSYHMSPEDVVAAISATNVVSPSGNAMIGGSYPLVPVNSVAGDVKALEAVPIKNGKLPAVFVRDVAEVVDSSDIVTSYALVDGKRAVYVPVTKRADASSLDVATLVKDSLPRFQGVLPSGVTVSYELDQSPYVTRALAGLPIEGVIGALLAGLMVFLFLRSARSALIVILTVPLALLAAILALWLTGQTLNIMTLGGLALAVGILVDQGTVCVENIHVHRATGKGIARAVYDATLETAGPQLLSMLCVVAMFTPALLMTGAVRAMFLPLAIAVAFAMAASYLLSTSLVPVLAVWLLRSCTAHVDGSPFARLRTRYAETLQRLVPRRGPLVLAYSAITLAVVVLVGGRLGTEIFPRVDAGQMHVRLRAPAGTDIDGTEALARRALEVIRNEVGTDNVGTSLGLVGVHGSAYPINLLYLWNGGTEDAVLQVQLRPGTTLTGALEERLRREFASQIPNAGFSFEPADLISRVMSLGASAPIEVSIGGPVLASNRAFAETVRARLAEIPQLRDVRFGAPLDYPTVNVAIDRERAGILGVDMRQASRALVPATSSSRFVVPNYWADPETGITYQVQVQIPQQLMTSLDEVGNLTIKQENGESVLLRNVARISEGTAPREYDRYNGQRFIMVQAGLAPGEDIGSASRLVSRALAGLGPPPAKVSVTVRGAVVPMGEMLEAFGRGMALAVIAILLLLTAYFQSIRLALITLSTVPAVLAGVALALALTGTTLNVQSVIGAIMAVGVGEANAILLVSFAETSRRTGATAIEAALEGARGRLRPILMTSIAMIAGMLPVAFGWGEGSGEMAPLARAVVGGLAFATLATLIVLPFVFALVQGRAHRRSASLYLQGGGGVAPKSV